jgi:AraC-like DNA-binding protein
MQIGELCCECGFNIKPHIQRCNEISCVVSGEGYFFVNGEKHPVKEGSIFINRKGELHSIESSEQSELRFLYVGFDFNDEETDSSLKKVIDYIENPASGKMAQDKTDFMWHFVRLINEFYSNSELSGVMIENYLTQILILTYRIFTGASAVKCLPSKSLNVVGSTVYSVIRYIDDNIMDIINVKDISDCLCYSYSYLSHTFRSKTGMTLQSYLNYKKIEKSLEFIDYGRLSITQIAFMLNYDTVQSFSKAFKRTIGRSPASYRESIGMPAQKMQKQAT